MTASAHKHQMRTGAACGDIPESIREYLRYDIITGALTWAKKPSRSTRIGAPVGTVNSEGYFRFMFRRRSYLSHRVIYFLETGEQPAFIDHRDGNRINNTIGNLRPATVSQNAANKVRPGTSGRKKGVSERNGRFIARVRHLNKNHHLGVFETEDDAYAAYVAAARALHGDFARLE